MLQGDWFSWEEGKNRFTSIKKHQTSHLGEPLYHDHPYPDTYLYVFRTNILSGLNIHETPDCFICSKYVIRSPNVMERYDSKFIKLKSFIQV